MAVLCLSRGGIPFPTGVVELLQTESHVGVRSAVMVGGVLAVHLLGFGVLLQEL